MQQTKDAILKTLLYADIFDYPLTEEEIFNFLIAPKKIKQEEVSAQLKNITPPIMRKGKYYFLEKKDRVLIREQRQKVSLGKQKKAKEIIRRISIIPSIKFVGISGALSMNNSDKDDDIDIFVISSKNQAWTTRFLLIIALKILGVYRDKNARDVSNKVCLNMILDEERLSFDSKRRDLYLAHEITQLTPVFDRDKTYKKFIESNLWTKKFLPNARNETSFTEKRTGFWDQALNNLLKILKTERILGFLQREYMRKNMTRETVQEGFLAFHPFDYNAHVRKLYKAKLKRYKVLNGTNKTRN